MIYNTGDERSHYSSVLKSFTLPMKQNTKALSETSGNLIVSTIERIQCKYKPKYVREYIPDFRMVMNIYERKRKKSH